MRVGASVGPRWASATMNATEVSVGTPSGGVTAAEETSTPGLLMVAPPYSGGSGSGGGVLVSETSVSLTSTHGSNGTVGSSGTSAGGGGPPFAHATSRT